MQVGGYSNEKGFQWLKRVLKKEKLELHKMTFEQGTRYYHLDAKFSVVDEGLVLYNADDVPSQEIMAYFKENDWNLVQAPRRTVCVSDQDFTCSGLNLNWLLLGPNKIVLEKQERDTVKFLRDEC